ncbi:hypothetical protein V1525DRAFT_270841 [Lipomyces kononenkoae]|uniref:Uncharacterized protein n=1 Tax=Lipomyces kononenkoae TaxID=34357 RepID=A0ACC3SVF3_LIPKO
MAILETMLLIDVFGSMIVNPHKASLVLRVLCGTTSNICLVEHLVHRALHHMIPCAAGGSRSSRN